MADKFSTTSQLELSRRDLIKTAAGLAGTAAIGSVATTGPALAADAKVTGYGVTTAQLKDWSVMTKSIGVTMDFTGTNNSVGVFLRDIVASQLGDKADLFIFESGTQNVLGPQGLYMKIDEKNPELKLWPRTSDDWKRSAVVVGKDGVQYGVPVIGNADSFGYFPAKVGANPDGSEELSWSLMFDSDKTRGRVAYDQTWTYSIGTAGLYLMGIGKAKIADVSDMTGPEAKTVVDYLIERPLRSRCSCSRTRTSMSSIAGNRRSARPTRRWATARPATPTPRKATSSGVTAPTWRARPRTAATCPPSTAC